MEKIIQQLDEKVLLRLAGIRINPLPHSRKRRLKIRRHGVMNRAKEMERWIAENEITGFQSDIDPLNQLPFNRTFFKNKKTGKDFAILDISYGVSSIKDAAILFCSE